MHAKKRVKNFLRTKRNDENLIKDTIDFLFNDNSSKQPIVDLMDELIILGFLIDEIDEPGKLRLFIYRNWFSCVPLFVKMQRDFEDHPLKAFAVVPIHSLKRKNFRLDSGALLHFLKGAGVPPMMPNGKRQTRFNDFASQWWTEHNNWYRFFLIRERVEKIERANQSKVFQHGIVTDGISMGLFFDKGPITYDETARKAKIKSDYENGRYQ